jgi:hypothetical protein
VNPYIFRIPGDTPELTFEDLSAWMGGRTQRQVGTTVTITYEPPDGSCPAVFWFRLYDLELAGIFAHCVEFTAHDDPHLATAAWISRIVYDNAIGLNVWRIRRRKADGPGPEVPRGRAGLLCVEGDRSRPVFGHIHTVVPARIEAQRERTARWQAENAARQERYAAESARREELKTYHGPDGNFYAIDDETLGHGYHWRAVDGSFYDTIGYIRDTRMAPGAQYAASPEPEPGPTAPPFAAFAGGPDHRRDALGCWSTLAAALAVISKHHEISDRSENQATQEELDRRAEQAFESRYQVARGPFADNDLPAEDTTDPRNRNRRQIMTAIIRRRHYCDQCRKWTEHEREATLPPQYRGDDPDYEDRGKCGECGEEYRCGECGAAWDVDAEQCSDVAGHGYHGPEHEWWQVIADGLPWQDADGLQRWTRRDADSLAGHVESLGYRVEVTPG